MKLEEFVKLIAGEFDETPIELFSTETRFKELEEYDSLAALSIISVIDEEMEVQVTGADLNKVTTLEELFNLAQKL
jgi:acyl carrier protein